WTSAYVIGWARERRFRIREMDAPETDRKSIAADRGIPEVHATETTISGRLSVFNRLLHTPHDHANFLQRRYHAQVARCVSCLALALAVLGLTLTVFRNNGDFERYAAAVELMALVVAFDRWWAARVANYLWIAARTKVELLR